MTDSDALARLRPWVDRARAFEGWSFDHLGIERLGPPLPWDYAQVVAEHAAGTRSALDIGTGGGERLAEMRHLLSPRVVATEEWHVNAPVARRALAPLGVEVVHAKSLRLPFREASFDLVIDRHEEFDPADVARVLAPGGAFVTQQVGAERWREVARHLPIADWSHVRPQVVHGLIAAGLEVVRHESHEERVRYPSLGEVVYMLEVTHVWELPDFTLERYLDALLRLEAECSDGHGLVLTEAYYLIVARKR